MCLRSIENGYIGRGSLLAPLLRAPLRGRLLGMPHAQPVDAVPGESGRRLSAVAKRGSAGCVQELVLIQDTVGCVRISGDYRHG